MNSLDGTLRNEIRSNYIQPKSGLTIHGPDHRRAVSTLREKSCAKKDINLKLLHPKNFLLNKLMRELYCGYELLPLLPSLNDWSYEKHYFYYSSTFITFF